MQKFKHDWRITIVETLDETQLSDRQKAVSEIVCHLGSFAHIWQQLAKFYPEASLAYMKLGGTYPFLAVPDELNLHLLVHLRRNERDVEM